MGVRPVGAMDWFGQGTFGKWPWEREAWGDEPPVAVSNKSYEIDFEKVAAQRPDLILGLYAELKRGDYDKLSKIAPTVAQAKGDPYTTPWRDMTRVAAKAVGRVEEGEKLIEETEARFAAFRKAHPETAEADGAGRRRRHRAEELLPLQLEGPARPVPGRARLQAVGEDRQAGRQELRHGDRQGARRPARRRPAVPPHRRARAQEARRRRAVQPARRRAREAGHRPALLHLHPARRGRGVQLGAEHPVRPRRDRKEPRRVLTRVLHRDGRAATQLRPGERHDGRRALRRRRLPPRAPGAVPRPPDERGQGAGLGHLRRRRDAGRRADARRDARAGRASTRWSRSTPTGRSTRA